MKRAANFLKLLLWAAVIIQAAAPPAGAANEINNIQIIRGNTGAIIKWTTNRPANSCVIYGRTPAYEDGLIYDSTMVTIHTINVTGLAARTLYHCMIVSVYSDGNSVNSPNLSFRTAVPSSIMSDDFNSAALNTRLWRFIDPVGDAKLTMTGRESAIAIPAGTAHEVWTTAPRLVQPANDTDFEIEVKFTSALSAGYQTQGVLIEKDSSNFLRFDFRHDGSNLRIFAATFVNGDATVRTDSLIAGGVPLYMRVKREEDWWTQSYSYEGKSWSTSGSFVHACSMKAVGVFVGNAGNEAPAYTGLIDYFINTASKGEIPVSIKTATGAPAHFALQQNYPNPFNPQTTIEFSLPTPGFVALKIFTSRGEEVAVLVSENLSAGRHKTFWNASKFPSGVYFYRLSVASSGQLTPLAASKKLLLVK